MRSRHLSPVLRPSTSLRPTLGTCLLLAVAVAALGLASLRIVPVTPPDSAFTARVAAARALGPTPR